MWLGLDLQSHAPHYIFKWWKKYYSYLGFVRLTVFRNREKKRIYSKIHLYWPKTTARDLQQNCCAFLSNNTINVTWYVTCCLGCKMTVGSPDKATPSISTSITILSRVGFVTAMSTATTECAAHVTSKVLSGGGAEAWTSIVYHKR